MPPRPWLPLAAALVSVVLWASAFVGIRAAATAFSPGALAGIICTALGLVAFFKLIAEAGPSRASVITYLNRLVAVVVGSRCSESTWARCRSSVCC